MDDTNETDSGQPEVLITKTNQNKPLAIVEGYGYILEKKIDERHYWKCHEHKKYDCRARLITNLVDGIRAVKTGRNRCRSESKLEVSCMCGLLVLRVPG